MFFKKKVIDTGINVTPAFPDLSNSTATSFNLADANAAQNAFILSGSVPDQPSYGAGQLNAGVLRMYCSDTNVKYNREPISLVGYAIDKEIPLLEGGFSFSVSGAGTTSVGQNLGVYSIIPYSDEPWLVEDFEGSPEGLEVVNRIQGNAMGAMTDPYITLTVLKQLLKAEGHQSGEKRISHLNKLLSPTREGGSYLVPTSTVTVLPDAGAVDAQFRGEGTTSSKTVYEVGNKNGGELMYSIEFEDNNTGRFKFKNRGSTKSGMWFVDKTALDFATQAHNIRFNQIKYASVSTAPSSVEGNPEADKGNTILSDFYATRNFSNPFDTTTDDPMITTSIELSAEKALNGGQSLRIYHNWGFADTAANTKNEIIQNQVQQSGNINPQCARVSLYDIPYPSMPADLGGSTWDDGTLNMGDPHVVVPELRLGLNITKLEPNVMLNLSAGTTAGYAATALELIADQSNELASGVSNQENTFLRSVVVTFSNYKPKKSHTTLDKFLYYGLNNFYNGVESDNIVGGVVFTRFGIDATAATADSSNMFGFPLPVMQIAQMAGKTPTTSSETLASGGIGKVLPGSSGFVGGVMTMENIDTLVWGNPAAPSSPDSARSLGDDELPYVNLPMNSWLNMRCFFDIFQNNNSGSATKRPYAPSGAKNPTALVGDRGVPMRIIFDTEGANDKQSTYDSTQSAGSENVWIDGGSRVKTDTRNLPFLDVFFPAANTGLGLPTQLRNWNWFENPAFWPKHMTIWVQNYPWVSGSATQPWLYGDQNLYPEGASREAEVFVDNIQMFNFEPTTKNISLKDVLHFKPATHLSPVQKMYETAGPKFKSGWVEGSPKELTGDFIFTTASNTIEIADNQHFDTSFLDNNGPTKMNLGSSGTKWVSSFKNRLEFRVEANGGVATFTGSPATDAARTPGTYTAVSPTTGGSGSAATFDITVAAGGVTTAVVNAAGKNYEVLDSLQFADADLGGGGAATFVLTVASIDNLLTNGTGSHTIVCSGTNEPTNNRANLSQYDTGMQLAYGVDHPDHLTSSSIGVGGTGYTGYILGNDFSTYSWNEVSDNALYPNKAVTQPSNASGAIFSQQITGAVAANGELPPDNFVNIMGGDFYIGGPGQHQLHTTVPDNVSGAALQVYKGTTAAVAGDMINLGISTGGDFASTNDFFSFDGFRQKGMMYTNISGSGTVKPTAGNMYARTRWGTREHVGVSTKITNLADTANSKVTGYEHLKSLNKNQIEVSDPDMFNFDNPDEKYVAYLMGATGSVTGIHKYRKGGLKLAEPPSENIITFTQDLYNAGDASTPLFVEENLHRLYIGPQKYWFTMMFDTDENNTERTYTSFCTIGQVPSLAGTPAAISGTTYAENQYYYNATFGAGTGGEQSLYVNEWNLVPTGDNATLVTSLDYGYGAMDEATNEGGYMVYGAIKPSNYNIWPLNALSNNYQVGDSIPILLYLEGRGGGQERSATFWSDDYTIDTSKVPMMFWSYLDLPPVISNLTVQPEVNVVEGNSDLYDLTTETLNAVKFEWEEENADDVWYRYMILDEKPINDKYHSCIMRLPLNEAVEGGAFGTAPTLKVYNPDVQVSTTTTVGVDVRQVIEGQGGYAPVLGGSSADTKITVASAANYRALEDLDEFSLVIHWTPAASDAGVKRYIVTQMDVTNYPGPSADDFIMYKDTDDTITVTMGTGVVLSSVKSVICDGEVPTNIIMTYNSGSSSPNKANLYIDGTWQDGSTGQTRVQGNQDFVVGGVYAASQSGSAGMFEEILIYNKELQVVNTANEYIMPTNNIDDFYDAVGNNSLNKENITHNARLFVSDYHNFRGYNSREQAMSNQTSWRTTTV